MKGTKLLQIGLLAVGLTAFGYAQTQTPYTLPPEVEEVVQGASLIVVVDTEGNTLWTSDSGIPLSEVTLPEGAVFVVYDAEGNPVLELPVTAGPNDNVLVQLPDGSLLPPGKLVREVAGPADGTMDGSGQMNQHQHRYQHQNQTGTSDDATAPTEPVKNQNQHRHQYKHQTQTDSADTAD